MDEKEIYAEKLAKRAENCLLALKILFFAGLAVAVGLVIFAIVAYTAMDDTHAKLIGFVVFVSVIAALLVGFAVCITLSQISLNKLKKIN